MDKPHKTVKMKGKRLSTLWNNRKKDKSMSTPRLKKIIDYVNTRVAADIGTDHAYVPIELIKSKRAARVIASDVRRGPLYIAKSNIAENGLSDKIETRLGSGLSVLSPGEADTVIIAGMGGELIADILSKDDMTARQAELILQPMNSQYELRRWLIDNNYTILKEDLENEGKRIYNILIVKSGRMRPYPKDIDYHLPPELYQHPEFHMLVDKKEREFNKIINGIERSKEPDTEKLKYYKNRLNDLENIKNDYCK